MKKMLTKSQNNQVFTGTLAGIAEYFGIDPTIARIIYVFASLTFIGAPIILYVVMALLVPSAENNEYQSSYSEYGAQPR